MMVNKISEGLPLTPSNNSNLPLRFLVLHWGTRGGGPQLQKRLVQSFVRRKDAIVFASYDARSEVANDLQGQSTDDFVVGRSYVSGRLAILLRLADQPLDALRLVRFCRVNGIRFIYEVMDHPLQLLPRMLARLCGIRVLGSVHDATRHSGEESTVLTLISAISTRMVDGTMTYSTAVASQVAATHLNRRAPVFETVHGAFGSVDIGPRTPPDTARQFTIGFFGRIERYKGISRLLEAAEVLQAEGRLVHIVVCGRGELSQVQRSELTSLGGEFDNRWIEEDKIQAIIDQFDVLALPYDEASQSGVVGYALSAGIPIVCTPVAGLAEQVSLSGGGVVSEGMSSLDYAEALRQVMVDPSLYGRLSEAGLRAARTIFSWDRVGDDAVAAMRSMTPPRCSAGVGRRPKGFIGE